MHGWTLWIEQGGRFRIVDVPIADFARAEAAALEFAGGGTVESYTRRPAAWMAKVFRQRPASAREVYDSTPKPTRGAVKRKSRADTAASRA